MKERPILFNAEMVRTVLSGAKTQTRRVVKYNHELWGSCRDLDVRQAGIDPSGWRVSGHVSGQLCTGDLRCPYGMPGDRLWVRETWQHGAIKSAELGGDYFQQGPTMGPVRGAELMHRASFDDTFTPPFPWKPSIFMPRWASRITLEVTNVRVERVQDIVEEDARAEGCIAIADRRCVPDPCTAVKDFSRLWDSINAKRGYSWESNPYVWVVGFKRLS